MARKIKESAHGTIQISRITAEEVRLNYAMSVQADGIGALDLEDSWGELITALLCLLYIRNPSKFMSRLFVSKIAGADLEVAPQLFTKHTDNIKIDAVKIPGAPYYLYYDLSYKTVPFKIKQLLTLLDINAKNAVVTLIPYSYVEQDDGFNQIKTQKRMKKLTLTETANIDFNKNKMLAVDILGSKVECRTYTQLISQILTYVSLISPDWFNRSAKYNKDIIIRIEKSKEEATLYEAEPLEIGNTGCYINQRMNANGIMEYLCSICKEFVINTDKIVLYCKEKDFSQVKSGVSYENNK